MTKSIIIRTLVYAGLGLAILLAARLAQTTLNQAPGDRLPPVRIDSRISGYLEAGDWEAARVALIAAHEQRDADPNLRYYISLCYKRLGAAAIEANAYHEAIEFFDAALTYTDDDPDIFLALGYAHLSLSEYTDAQRAFEEALVLDPDNFMAHQHMGQIHYLQDEVDRAVTAWSRALELNPANDSLKNRLEKLQKQVQASAHLDTDANHLFSVRYDGEAIGYPEDSILEMLEEAYYAIGAKLNAYPKRQIAVTLLTRETFFDMTGSPEWTAGLYEGQIKIPVASANPAYLRVMLFHEYVHAVIFDLMNTRCPWWINEGIAQYFSENDAQIGKKNVLAFSTISGDRQITLGSLPGVLTGNAESVGRAYAMAVSALGFLIQSYGESSLQLVVHEMAAGKDVNDALETVTGSSLASFEADWRRSLRYSLSER